MHPYKRSTRVADLLREEIANIVFHKLKDPRIGFLSITDVKVTEDLRIAKVYFTVLENSREKETLKILNHSKGYIRKELAKRIRIKFLPEILFEIDESVKHGDRIERILKEIDLNKI